MVLYLDGKPFQDDDADRVSLADFGARFEVEKKISPQPAKPLDEGFRAPEEAVLLLPDVEHALPLEPVARLTAQVRQLLGVETHVVVVEEEQGGEPAAAEEAAGGGGRRRKGGERGAAKEGRRRELRWNETRLEERKLSIARSF